MEAKKSVTHKKTTSRRNLIIAIAVGLIVIVSGYIVFQTRAGGLFASADVSNATVTGQATKIDDTTAAAGKAIQFGQAPQAPPPVASSWPGAHNTGVPIGLPGDTRPKVANKASELPMYTGPMTITQEGTVIDGKHVHGTLYIKAKNVVIKNSYLTVNMGTNDTANAVQTHNDDANLTVMDTEIDAQESDNTRGGAPLVSRTGYTLLRVNIHGSGDLIRIDGNGTVKDSWLHDPRAVGTQHNDVIQSTNATYIRILHNRLENQNTQTSCILLKADIGPISDVVVDGNLLNGGGYCFYWYDANYKITNGRFTNNRFMRQPTGGFWPKGGYHGTHALNAQQMPVWSNNVWDDTGAQIAQ